MEPATDTGPFPAVVLLVAGHTIAHDKAATADAIPRVKEFLDRHL